MKKFKWDEYTKYEDIGRCYLRLMPACTNLDALDELNQVEHIRFRVQHEVDICDEEGIEETGMTPREYNDAKRFLRLTHHR